ncbi:MAG: MarR family transcriptional regulator [Chloroflexi bacterium]|nr:MarR family transcriptional regulator [Chloroflexota bacterium]
MDRAQHDKQVEAVASLFRQVMRLQRRASPQDWTMLDLSMAQTKVLFVLHHDGPARVSHLADALDVSAPSMTGTLERLVRQGLVERRDDPSDRRLVIIAPTAAGQALVERLQQGRRAQLQAALAHLDLEALAELERGLAALLAAMPVPERGPVAETALAESRS